MSNKVEKENEDQENANPDTRDKAGDTEGWDNQEENSMNTRNEAGKPGGFEAAVERHLKRAGKRTKENEIRQNEKNGVDKIIWKVN